MGGEEEEEALEGEAEEATVGVAAAVLEAVAAAGAVVVADVMETGLARELDSYDFCMHAHAQYQ